MPLAFAVGDVETATELNFPMCPPFMRFSCRLRSMLNAEANLTKLFRLKLFHIQFPFPSPRLRLFTGVCFGQPRIEQSTAEKQRNKLLWAKLWCSLNFRQSFSVSARLFILAYASLAATFCLVAGLLQATTVRHLLHAAKNLSGNL